MPKDIAVQVQRAYRQLNIWGALRAPRPRRVLDIGCASGVMLEHCKLYFDCEIFGIELGIVDQGLMTKKGIPWAKGIDAAPGKFNLIVMSHVLEHFDQPVQYLREVREKVAAPKADLLIEIPLPKKSVSAFSKFHYGVFNQEPLYRALTLGGWVPANFQTDDVALQWAVGRLT